MRSIWLMSLSVAAFAVPVHSYAQQGAPEESTIKDTANSVTEPFDGKEVPPKLLAIQEDRCQLLHHPSFSQQNLLLDLNEVYLLPYHPTF